MSPQHNTRQQIRLSDGLCGTPRSCTCPAQSARYHARSTVYAALLRHGCGAAPSKLWAVLQEAQRAVHLSEQHCKQHCGLRTEEAHRLGCGNNSLHGRSGCLLDGAVASGLSCLGCSLERPPCRHLSLHLLLPTLRLILHLVCCLQTERSSPGLQH